MEKQIVIYPSEYDAENDQLIEGSTICVMRPTPEGLAKCKSVYDFAEKHVPELRPFIQVSDEDLPEDATFEEALERANSDPRVKVLHWNNTRCGDSRITNIKGWYQGACGNIETIPNTSWDTVLLKEEENMSFDIGANIGKWTNANLKYYNKIISVEASPYTFSANFLASSLIGIG